MSLMNMGVVCTCMMIANDGGFQNDTVKCTLQKNKIKLK